MFTFHPLPLASVVGLQPAAAALDGFMPPRWAASAAALGLPVNVSTNNADTLRRELAQLGDPDGVALLDAVWDLWLEQRESVEAAVNAQHAVVQWQARRKASGNSPQARKQLRSWSQQAAELVPPATGVADRVAVAVNGAAQGVTPIPEPIRKVVPSWR